MLHIAIDGPAGSGKSTIAKIIANKLNINYLDSGALYRIIGYCMKKNNIDTNNIRGVINSLDNIVITLKDNYYYLNDEKIENQIRMSYSGKLASQVAKIPEVREKVNSILRNISEKHSTIIDGRDIGTVVLPNAEYKIFLTASSQERAKRRFDELIKKGENVIYDDVLSEIVERDNADMNREIAPLKPADDSHLVDTTGKSIEDVATEIYLIIGEK